MEDASVAMIVLIGSALKQVLAIVAATLCIYFGYRLFYLTEERAGEFEASSNWGKVRLTQVAPGVFFTLFGCIVLVIALATTSSFETGDVTSGSAVKGQPAASSTTGHLTGRSLRARGSGAPSVQTLDWTLCARSADYARNAVRSDPAFADKANARGKFLRDREDGLERVTAYCVDQALGQNSFARYQKVEMSNEGPDGADDEDRKAHTAVSGLLGS